MNCHEAAQGTLVRCQPLIQKDLIIKWSDLTKPALSIFKQQIKKSFFLNLTNYRHPPNLSWQLLEWDAKPNSIKLLMDMSLVEVFQTSEVLGLVLAVKGIVQTIHSAAILTKASLHPKEESNSI